MRHRLLLTLIVISVAVWSRAEERREVRAVRTDRPPVIDGRIDEVAWQSAPLITGLRQQRPDNGQPSSEASEVRLLYDDDALYVAARMLDRHPVTRLLGRRDTFLECDWFGILLDPLFDRRTGNAFFVNPDGVQYDEVISNDDAEDTDWDGVWQSATAIDPDGWSAEMRIPLSQLRFRDGESQTWGINFIRWIKRRQEQARMETHPRNERGFASRFGNLVGIDGIRPRPRIEVTPYAVSQAATNREFDGGLDMRWTTRSNITAAATINPDFGQVEVDPAILDLSGFELFYPEKRPFFVDGAKIFTFSGLTTTYYSPFRIAQPLLFYSRRIGRDDTKIRGAAKVIGSAGSNSYSAIDAVTEGTQPRTNYLGTRLTHDLGSRARVGLLVTSVVREESRSLPSQSTVIGSDGYSWLPGGKVLVDWFLAASSVRGSRDSILALQRSAVHRYAHPDPDRRSLDGWGGKAAISKENGMWRYQVQAESYSPGFEINDLGFQSRADIQAAHAMGAWVDVAQRKRTRSNRVSIGRYITRNHAGNRLADGVAGDATTTLRNYWTLTLRGTKSFRAFDDRESRGGPVIRRPAGWTSQAIFTTDARRKFWGSLAQAVGEDEDGGSISVSQIGLTVRPRSNINVSVDTIFTNNVVASKWIGSTYFARLEDRRVEVAPRVDWTIRTNLTLQLYLQPFHATGTYERYKQFVDDDYQYTNGLPAGLADPDFELRTLRGNAVLRWEIRGASTVFLVWNQERNNDQHDDRFLMKVSHRFDLPR